MDIDRPAPIRRIGEAFSVHPIGSRQCGKTTLARAIATEAEVAGHAKAGASFEGFAIEQLLVALETDGAYFWATHGGAELDLLVTLAGKRYGFECKLADAPGTARSMRVALDDLGLEHLWILYPGSESYALDDRISVHPIAGVFELVAAPRSGASRTFAGA